MWAALVADTDPRVRLALVGAATPSLLLERLAADGDPGVAAAAADLLPAPVSAEVARSGEDQVVPADGGADTADEELLVVRVFGASRVDGCPTLTPIELSFVVYLACRGGSAGKDQVLHAVWAGQAREMKTLRQLVYQVRSKLGEAHVPHRRPVDDDITLTRVGTDLDVLAAAAAAVEDLDDAATLAALEPALELVEGRPFGGAVEMHWAYEDGDVRAAEAVIEQATLIAVGAATALGDNDARRRLLTIGMRALPGDEPLYRAAMQLAADEHNRSRVISLYRELEAVLAEQESAPSPDTIELFHCLRGDST